MNLAKANRILDRLCKANGLDPVAVRLALINAIGDKTRETVMGKKPTEEDGSHDWREAGLPSHIADKYGL